MKRLLATAADIPQVVRWEMILGKGPVLKSAVVALGVGMASWPLYLVLAGGHSGVYTAVYENPIATLLFLPVIVAPIFWPQENLVLIRILARLLGSEYWAIAILVSVINGVGYGGGFFLTGKLRELLGKKRSGQERP